MATTKKTVKKKNEALEMAKKAEREMDARTNKELVEKVVNGISKEDRAAIYADKIRTVRSQIIDAEVSLYFVKEVSPELTKKKIKEYKATRQKVKERGSKEEKIVSKYMIDNLEERLRKNEVDAVVIQQNITEYSLFITRLFEKAEREGIEIKAEREGIEIKL